ncbi:hypothetical protein [Paenibacillus haidiansis]
MKSLVVLDRFKGLFEKLGFNYPAMRRILQIKLLMDGRRAPTIVGNSRKKDKKNQFIGSLWLYLLMGGFSSVFLAIGNNSFFQVSFIFGIFMFMIMTSLIADFSSVLLDTRDRSILATKPVDRRTIAMAKTLHILFYMFFVTGALAIVPLGVGVVKHGIGFALLFLIELILMDLLIVVFTALIYLVILKFYDGERLKDLINYVQIGLTVALAVGYQFLVRLFDFMGLQAELQPEWWQFLIVPVWFGAPFEVLLHGNGQSMLVLLSLLSVFVPILAFLLYVKLMPLLENNLQKLSDPGRGKKAGQGKWPKRLSRLLCANPEEEVFFRFAWTMLGNEREFKLKVYPTLGLSLIFPFLFMFMNGATDGLYGLAKTRMYLFIYFSALLVPTVVMMLKYSGSYKAAWIYRALPIGDMLPVYRGTLLAAAARLIMPLYALEALIMALLFGADILPDLLVAGLAILVFTVLSFAYLSKGLPFSERFEAAQQGEGVRMIPLYFLLAGLGFIHFMATKVSYGIYVYAAILPAANWILWRKLFGKLSRRE